MDAQHATQPDTRPDVRPGDATRASRSRRRTGRPGHGRGFTTRGKTLAEAAAWRPPASPDEGRRILERWQAQEAAFEPLLPYWAIGLGASAWVHAPGPDPTRTAVMARLSGADLLAPIADMALASVRLVRTPSGLGWDVSLTPVRETVTDTAVGLGFGPPQERWLGLPTVRPPRPILRFNGDNGLFRVAVHLAEWAAVLALLPPWDPTWRAVWTGPQSDPFEQVRTLAYADVQLGADRSWLTDDCVRDPSDADRVFLPWPPSEAVRATGIGDARLCRTLVRVTADDPLGGTVVPVGRARDGAVQAYTIDQPALIGWWVDVPAH